MTSWPAFDDKRIAVVERVRPSGRTALTAQELRRSWH